MYSKEMMFTPIFNSLIWKIIILRSCSAYQSGLIQKSVRDLNVCKVYSKTRSGKKKKIKYSLNNFENFI